VNPCDNAATDVNELQRWLERDPHCEPSNLMSRGLGKRDHQNASGVARDEVRVSEALDKRGKTRG
jgi:hypothetical protein